MKKRRSPFQSKRFLGRGIEGRQSWLQEAFNAYLEISRDFNSWLQGVQPALTQTRVNLPFQVNPFSSNLY